MRGNILTSFTEYKGYTEGKTTIDRNIFVYLREETSTAKLLQKKIVYSFSCETRDNLFICLH